jgi:hypothetical protein
LLKIPGALTGLVTGLIVGALAAIGGAPTGFVVASGLGLGVPLALFGVAYDLLLDAGKLRFGGVAPAALFGVVAFPISRLMQELVLILISGTGVTLQQEAGVLQFLAFQSVMGFGYGIGFLMIHSQIMEVSAWRQYRRQNREEKENQPHTAEKRA